MKQRVFTKITFNFSTKQANFVMCPDYDSVLNKKDCLFSMNTLEFIKFLHKPIQKIKKKRNQPLTQVVKLNVFINLAFIC